MATVAEMQTAIDAAATAIGNGDYAAGRQSLIQAKVILAGIPDGRKGTSEVRWGRERIDDLLGAIGDAESAAGGIQFSKVTYARPTS